ncbi:hypothetical protein FB451DRAFT_1252782 [Mycena latifolia]|nr:hypothetical protein FB451DRAFT_1252782 [Mycena latifolia]
MWTPPSIATSPSAYSQEDTEPGKKDQTEKPLPSTPSAKRRRNAANTSTVRRSMLEWNESLPGDVDGLVSRFCNPKSSAIRSCDGTEPRGGGSPALKSTHTLRRNSVVGPTRTSRASERHSNGFPLSVETVRPHTRHTPHATSATCETPPPSPTKSHSTAPHPLRHSRGSISSVRAFAQTVGPAVSSTPFLERKPNTSFSTPRSSHHSSRTSTPDVPNVSSSPTALANSAPHLISLQSGLNFLRECRNSPRKGTGQPPLAFTLRTQAPTALMDSLPTIPSRPSVSPASTVQHRLAVALHVGLDVDVSVHPSRCTTSPSPAPRIPRTRKRNS